MKHLSRRSFLTTAAASGSLAVMSTGCSDSATSNSHSSLGKRNHPLEGITREKIKITDIKVTPISYVPPDARILWTDGDYEVWKTDAALTEVFTDQGIIGIGEGTPYEHPLVIKKYTEEYIKPLLVGQNPFDVEYLTCNGFNRKDRAPWAGVENALWDIIGKAAGLPVFRVLDLEGDAKSSIRIYASGGDNQPWYSDEAADNLI
jgi:L-alanine-DL-glutamate epimerase-like enolase superfamily enzyme